MLSTASATTHPQHTQQALNHQVASLSFRVQPAGAHRQENFAKQGRLPHCKTANKLDSRAVSGICDNPGTKGVLLCQPTLKHGSASATDSKPVHSILRRTSQCPRTFRVQPTSAHRQKLKVLHKHFYLDNAKPSSKNQNPAVPLRKGEQFLLRVRRASLRFGFAGCSTFGLRSSLRRCFCVGNPFLPCPLSPL